MRFEFGRARWTILPGCAPQFISGPGARSPGSCCLKGTRGSRPSQRISISPSSHAVGPRKCERLSVD